ncbi:hypothetical protein BaRGS_00028283, partial [Batillaria attramentaria]
WNDVMDPYHQQDNQPARRQRRGLPRAGRCPEQSGHQMSSRVPQHPPAFHRFRQGAPPVPPYDPRTLPHGFVDSSGVWRGGRRGTEDGFASHRFDSRMQPGYCNRAASPAVRCQHPPRSQAGVHQQGTQPYGQGYPSYEQHSHQNSGALQMATDQTQIKKGKRQARKMKAKNESPCPKPASKERNTKKEELTREMVESARTRFPDLGSRLHFVPPLRFLTTKYVKLKQYSTQKHHVVKQTLTDPSALIGDLTEDVVTRCVARVVEWSGEAMFVLSNYQLDGYLLHLHKKDSNKKKKKSGVPSEARSVSKPVSETPEEKDSSQGLEPKMEKVVSSEARRMSDTVSESLKERDFTHSLKPNLETAVSREHNSVSELVSETVEGESSQILKSEMETLNPSEPSATSEPVSDTLEERNTSHSKTGMGMEFFTEETVCPGQSPYAYLSTNGVIERVGPELVDTTIQRQNQNMGTKSLGRAFPVYTQRGEFDILIISPKLGFIVFETKTISGDFPNGKREQASSEKKECDFQQEARLPSTDIAKQTQDVSPMGTKTPVPQNVVGAPGERGKVHKTTDKKEIEHQQETLLSSTDPQQIKGTNPTPEQLVTEAPDIQDRQTRIVMTGPSGEIGEATETTETEETDVQQGKPLSEQRGKEKGPAEEDVKRTLAKGISQLKRAREVLQHLVSDLTEQPPVTTVLALPNVSRAQLRRLAEDPSLQKIFCEGFNTTTVQDAVSRCMCWEEVATFSRVQTADLDSADSDIRLLQWWRNLSGGTAAETSGDSQKLKRKTPTLKGPKEPEAFSSELYEQIIARFCGCYSRLTTATAADCINLTGVCFGRSILREEQLNIMNSEDRFVFIAGPPGAGKTLVIGLKAAEWAMEGYHVIIVRVRGVNWGSLVSWTLYERVVESCRSWSSSQGNGSGKTKGTVTGPAGGDSDPAECSAFVHMEDIDADTDIPLFVQAMLRKHSGGKGLKFIVDECQRTTTHDQQKCRLAACEENLVKIKTLYEKLMHAADSLSCTPPRVSSGHHKNLVAKADVSLKGKEAQAMDSFSAQPQFLSLTEYFTSMTERLGRLSARLELLKKATGTASFTYAGYWPEALSRIENLRRDIASYRQGVEEPVLLATERGDMDVNFAASILDDIDKQTVFAMGALYNAHNSLTFFVEDKLFAELRQRQEEDGCRGISLWTSSMCPHYKPEGFLVKELGEILRCPPSVQEVMMLTEKDLSSRDPPNYTYITTISDANPPLPSYGPDVKWIDHAPHMTSASEVIDCRFCAEALADYLLNELEIGREDSKKSSQKNLSLQLDDVIISGAPIHHQDCKFIQALRERGIPVEFERQGLEHPPPYPGKAFVI